MARRQFHPTKEEILRILNCAYISTLEEGKNSRFSKKQLGKEGQSVTLYQALNWVKKTHGLELEECIWYTLPTSEYQLLTPKNENGYRFRITYSW